MRLSHKTVLITGAARGIGQAIARRCAEHGADVIGVDLPQEDLTATARIVEATGQRFYALAGDVSDPAHASTLIEQAIRANDGFDVLINNAGVAPSGPFQERDFEVWQQTVQTNLTGLMAMTHAALPHLRTRFRAHIVNLGSLSGKLGTPGLVAYSAAKHGVVGFSAALRAELTMQRASIGVNCVLPTLVDTRMTKGVARSNLVPLIQPDEVAAAVVQAIERNESEVYVPGRTRWLFGWLPALFPALAEWLTVHDATARGWLAARKNLPDRE